MTEINFFRAKVEGTDSIPSSYLKRFKNREDCILDVELLVSKYVIEHHDFVLIDEFKRDSTFSYFHQFVFRTSPTGSFFIVSIFIESTSFKIL